MARQWTSAGFSVPASVAGPLLGWWACQQSVCICASRTGLFQLGEWVCVSRVAGIPRGGGSGWLQTTSSSWAICHSRWTRLSSCMPCAAAAAAAYPCAVCACVSIQYVTCKVPRLKDLCAWALLPLWGLGCQHGVGACAAPCLWASGLCCVMHTSVIMWCHGGTLQLNGWADAVQARIS